MLRIDLKRDADKVFEIIHYPAGETQVRLINPDSLKNTNGIEIVARLFSAQDIITLALLKDAVSSVFFNPVHLFLPYLPYGRADRRFKVGDCFGLQVFSQLVNSMKFSSVKTLDAHSDKGQYSIDNFVVENPSYQINIAVQEFKDACNTDTIIILYPDKGASKRYNLPLPSINCEKERDPVTGKFLKFIIPEVPQNIAVLIVDDICDGGGTFLGIAKELAKRSTRLQLGLYTTHGIFSKGFKELEKYFYKLYSTDSVDLAETSAILTVFPALEPRNSDEG